MMSAFAPWLLCLNLNREYVTPGRPLHAQSGALAASHARTLLYGARERGWTIVHVQGKRGRLSNTDFARPIEGLEPLPSEPLFLVRQKSALAHPDLRARLSADRPSALYLIGFTLAHEGLATFFDAVDLGLSPRIVADAMASPSIGDRSSTEIDRAALAIAAALSGVTNSSEALSAASSVVVGFKGA
ncbi:MAG: cysteine hydrolase family protein [Caulobacteraceae bacterium]